MGRQPRQALRRDALGAPHASSKRISNTVCEHRTVTLLGANARPSLPPKGHGSLAFSLLTRVAPCSHRCDPRFRSPHTRTWSTSPPPPGRPVT